LVNISPDLFKFSFVDAKLVEDVLGLQRHRLSASQEKVHQLIDNAFDLVFENGLVFEEDRE